jgi:transposase
MTLLKKTIKKIQLNNYLFVYGRCRLCLISHYDKELYSLLKTISGIGPLAASVLITELGDINRFIHINHLSSYVELIPRVRESGETTHTGGITFRCNTFLRTLFIESSWR